MSGLSLTKFTVPQAPHSLVERPRLRVLLDQGAALRLALIAAPAGYGKTMAVADWLSGRVKDAGGRVRSAWLSLDADDNHPARFWAYLVRALGDDFAALAQCALAQLGDATPPQPRQLLVALLNQLATSATTYLLVLDDYHLITEPSIHQGLSFLLDHLPPALHLLILTRAEPPLPLARLRARGQLLHIDADQLRCTAGEATLLLRGVMGLALPNATISQVYARSEGWFAGLHLLGLALADCPNPAMLATLAARPRYVSEYLIDEVLSQQPPATQTFLLSTAILDQVCDELAAALLDAPNASQCTLEAYHCANLFVFPLDGQRHWYRYHPLFAEALREHLDRHAAARVPLLHRRAAHWYARNGNLLDALQHTIRAQDWAQAAEHIEELVRTHSWRADEHARVLHWIDQLPDADERARLRAAVQVQPPQIDHAPQLVGSAASTAAARVFVLTLSSDDDSSQRALSGLHEMLSRREQEVLELVAAGASNAQIAQQLVIEVATVKRHISSILGKLDSPSRTHAVARARALGLLDDAGSAYPTLTSHAISSSEGRLSSLR